MKRAAVRARTCMVRAGGYAIEHRRAHLESGESPANETERFNANATPRGCRRRHEKPRLLHRRRHARSTEVPPPKPPVRSATVTAPPRRQQIGSRVKPKPLYA